MDVSIIICTADRADDLRDTLSSLAAVRPCGRTELLVVDNKSTDHTRQVVKAATRDYPFPLRYLHEGNPGKYAALNSGIRQTTGRVIVGTDDDVRFEPDWLERAVDGLSRYGCEFVGGRVLPLWGGKKPVWLDEHNAIYMKVIALLDHGPCAREFGRGISWPLGVNVAYRREAFDRVGLFDNRLGRKAGTLRNQAQREWHLRARVQGARGFYLPDMVVHHLVKNERLTKRYFRRWLYWHGISRAMLFQNGGFDMEEPECASSAYAGARQIGGVPVPLILKAGRSLRSAVWHALRGDRGLAFDYELWLCFFAGIVRQRWADRNLPHPIAAEAEPQPAHVRSPMIAVDHRG